MTYDEDDIKKAAGQAMRAGVEAGKSAEQERIIKLLTDAKQEQLSPDEALAKGWRFDEPTGKWWLPQEALIALIKG
jgi:hypothetical protein